MALGVGVAERNADVVRRGTSDASETAMAVGKFMSLSAYFSCCLFAAIAVIRKIYHTQ